MCIGEMDRCGWCLIKVDLGVDPLKGLGLGLEQGLRKRGLGALEF